MKSFATRALVVLFAVLVAVLAAGAAWGGPPGPGDVLPAFSLPAPKGADAKASLGIGDVETFGPADIAGEYLLIEVIGVYCPICLKQAPILDSFYKKLQNNPELAGRLKVVGAASGATPQELAYLAKKKLYAFPVVGDPDFSVHKLLGEPKTPFTLLVDKRGKVIFTHLGALDDADAFYNKMESLAK